MFKDLCISFSGDCYLVHLPVGLLAFFFLMDPEFWTLQDVQDFTPGA